jgi:hypothetical protein
MATRIRRTHHRSHTANVKRGSITIICPSHERAHALRHELDKMGALSKRHGRRVSTTASMKLIRAAQKRAKRSTHHGQTR